MSITIRKELYIPAPRPGVAVYAMGQTYTRSEGGELIETVGLEARHTGPRPFPVMGYYWPELQTRLSPDNGRTWAALGEPIRHPMNHIEGERVHCPHYHRDPHTGRLLRFFMSYLIRADLAHEESYSDAGTTGRSRRLWYQVSPDAGRTWGPVRQVIESGYDAVHWGPGLVFQKSGGLYGGPVLSLPDGTVLATIVVQLFDGTCYQSGFVRGRWTPAGDALDWEFSRYLRVPQGQSSQGCCEPAPALLDDGRIFVSLRCCGDRVGQTYPSLKFCTLSADGGRTFGQPVPLTYEDGQPVWSPSSLAAIIRPQADRRYYWIGNILDAPTYGSSPRYPLCIAELLPDRGCLVRGSVTVIDTVRDWDEARMGRPRRYTNFGIYEDRRTGEIVLTLPEQPRTSWADFTADCYRYRIAVR